MSKQTELRAKVTIYTLIFETKGQDFLFFDKNCLIVRIFIPILEIRIQYPFLSTLQ